MKLNSLPLPFLYLLSITLFLLTFFWGYCWNWWAQGPLWQFLFQPICPLGSDEARYPQNVDVLVSGKYDPIAGAPLPSGQQMFYYSAETSNLYNFVNHTHQQVILPDSIRISPNYITDKWALIEVYKPQSSVIKDGYALFNLETNTQVDLTEIPVDGKLHEEIPIEIYEIVRQSQEVYVSNGFILVAPIVSENTMLPNYIVMKGRDIYPSSEYSEQIVKNLLNINVTAINRNTTKSSDGRFYYDPSFTATIFEQGTNRKIAVSPLVNFVPTGWANEQQGLVMISVETPCLFAFITCLIGVPQPILLLRQDPDYLTPDIQAQFASQDALEARNKQQADTVMVGLMIATVGSIAFTVRTHLHLVRRETPV